MEAKREDVELAKKLNPELKKIPKFQNNFNFFLASSYLFDDANNAYKLDKILGKGGFGVVKSGIEVKTGKRVAIKIQNINRQIEYHNKTIHNLKQARIYVLEQLEIEDTLLKLTGQFVASTRRINLQNQEKHYSIMEYIEGGLLKNIFPGLALEKKIHCFIEITQQMIFLHEKGYLHLDIWRENILFDGRALLNDYGCAAKLVEDYFLSKLKGFHVPPEIIKSHQKREVCIYGKFSDVYALGMTFYELFYEDYYDYSLDKTLDEFIARYSKYYKGVVATLASENSLLARLINNMMSPFLTERPLAQEILCSLNLMNTNSDILIEQNNLACLLMDSY